jgi:hypothetical protein
MPALAVSHEVFEVLSKSLGFVPIVGENLKSAFELGSKICEEIQVSEHRFSPTDHRCMILLRVQTIQENREGYERIRVQVQNLLGGISSVIEKEKDYIEQLSARKPLVENLQRCVSIQISRYSVHQYAGLSRVLGEILTVIHDRIPSPSATTKRSSAIFGSVRRAVTDAKHMFSDKEKIKAMQQKLEDAMNQFGVRTRLLTSATTDQFFFGRSRPMFSTTSRSSSFWSVCRSSPTPKEVSPHPAGDEVG